MQSTSVTFRSTGSPEHCEANPRDADILEYLSHDRSDKAHSHAIFRYGPNKMALGPWCKLLGASAQEY